MTDPHIVRPGDAPTPFTADEIRRGCGDGRTVTSVTRTGAGEVTSVSRFSEGDDEGASIAADGQSLRVTWHDLQAHASFPADSTTITTDTIETPLGELECLRYEVTRDDGTHTFWFATERPGMPIRHSVERNGDTLSTTTVTADEYT
jgi:hypothetical protein